MTAPSTQPVGDRIPHNDLIERWQQEKRDELGAELAVHVRNYAWLYGEEFAREFLEQGFVAYHRDVREATR